VARGNHRVEDHRVRIQPLTVASRRGIVLAGFQTAINKMARFFMVLGLLLCAACAEQQGTTALPVPEVPPSKLVPFTGTLQPRATDTYTFTVLQSGYVQVTLVGLGAPAATTVGLGIGTPSTTGVCSLSYSVTTAAGPSAQLIGTGIAGTLCITIHDEGSLTVPAPYTITVASS
jgi:hypothetical protein